ncbi:hypothetical protein RFI_36338, partial [Reticulomyxa filosa]
GEINQLASGKFEIGSVDNCLEESTTLPPIIVDTRIIIYIRHAKSTWNDAEATLQSKVSMFGKGLYEQFRAEKEMDKNKSHEGAAQSATSNSTDVNPSNSTTIMDAPLSDEGILQAIDLHYFLMSYRMNTELTASYSLLEICKNAGGLINTRHNKTPKEKERGKRKRKSSKVHRRKHKRHVQLCKKPISFRAVMDAILGTDNDSIVLTSNLRSIHFFFYLLQFFFFYSNKRIKMKGSIDTAIIGLSSRFCAFPLENLHMLSCLQEFGRNPDTRFE